MDVEPTIEFILQMQAKAEVRAAQADERAAQADERAAKAELRMDRYEARMAKSDARMDKFDKRLEAIGKLIQIGMTMMAQTQKSLRELAEAQKKTDRKLDRLIDSWGKQRTNGRPPRS